MALSSYLKHPISIIEILASFKLACDANHIHEGATIRLLPTFYLCEALAKVLDRYMYEKNCFASFPALERNQDRRFQKFLRSYASAVNYLSNTFGADQAVTEYAHQLPRYM